GPGDRLVLRVAGRGVARDGAAGDGRGAAEARVRRDVDVAGGDRGAESAPGRAARVAVGRDVEAVGLVRRDLETGATDRSPVRDERLGRRAPAPVGNRERP